MNESEHMNEILVKKYEIQVDQILGQLAEVRYQLGIFIFGIKLIR